jgi:hypothetical protein
MVSTYIVGKRLSKMNCEAVVNSRVLLHDCARAYLDDVAAFNAREISRYQQQIEEASDF